MSHTLKLFLKITHNKIYKNFEAEIGNTQFGFRNGMGTREALFGINMLAQTCLDMNQDLYLCYIDFEKAFDKDNKFSSDIDILRGVRQGSRVVFCLHYFSVSTAKPYL